MIKLLKKHILQLETDLLNPEIRKSIEKAGEFLSDKFIEFCSSGYIEIFCIKHLENVSKWC